ncbi:hypothetical protein D3C85_1596940 [compost metagenome]
MLLRRQPRLDFVGHALFQIAGELEQGFFGDFAFMDVDQHAGETQRLILFIKLATATGQHPQVIPVGAQYPVFGVKR